jgi:hypothetical protein
MQLSLKFRRAPTSLVLALLLAFCLVDGTAGTAGAVTGSRARAPLAPGVRPVVRSTAQAHRTIGGGAQAPRVIKRNFPNWAGYVATGPANAFTSVSASWVVPSINCSSGTSYSDAFVAFDGYGSTNPYDFQSVGTWAQCNGTHPVYSAVYEFPPAGVLAAFAVSPGVIVKASVSYLFPKITVKITDNHGHSFMHSGPSVNDPRHSVEVIAGNPTQSGKLLPLANFKKITFTSCDVNGKAIGSYTKQPLVELTMKWGTTLKAAPGNLTGGNAFSVTWYHR